MFFFCSLTAAIQTRSARGGSESQELLYWLVPPLICLQLFHQTGKFFHPCDLLICEEFKGNCGLQWQCN